jgi:hypothetical protein
LFEVVGATDALCASLGFGQRRQEHRRQNRDDRDDNEQFNQSERPDFVTKFVHILYWFCFSFQRTVREPICDATHCQPVTKSLSSTVNATTFLCKKAKIFSGSRALHARFSRRLREAHAQGEMRGWT